MLFKTVILSFALLSATAFDNDDDGCTLTSDVIVSIAPPSFDLIPASPLAMDVYTCDEKDYRADIIFAVGAPLFDAFGERAGKLAWSKLSSRLAKRGYRVSVLERPFSFFPGAQPSLSFVLPSDFDRAIAHLGFPETVYIGGHSFGGSQALLYIAGQVPGFPLTLDLDTGLIPPQFPDSSVKGVLSSGSAIFEPMNCDQIVDFSFPPVPTTEPTCEEVSILEANNIYEIPVLLMYGDGERLYADPLFNAGSVSGARWSYDNQNPAKAFVVLKNCDHNSLLDVDLTFLSNTVNSTLSRDEQNRRSFKAMIKWLKVVEENDNIDESNSDDSDDESNSDDSDDESNPIEKFCTILPTSKITECLSETW